MERGREKRVCRGEGEWLAVITRVQWTRHDQVARGETVRHREKEQEEEERRDGTRKRVTQRHDESQMLLKEGKEDIRRERCGAKKCVMCMYERREERERE